MAPSNLARFSGVLWSERDVLTDLVARLASGPSCCDDLMRDVRMLEMERAVVARAVAVELGAEQAWTLEELTAAAPEEWVAVLGGHQRALRALASLVVSVPAPDAGARPSLQRSLSEFLD